MFVSLAGYPSPVRHKHQACAPIFQVSNRKIVKKEKEKESLFRENCL
jgi:hypothetical protein